MIRAGARGEGKWRRVSWDEALTYVAGRLRKIKDEHGARSILLSDRGGPFREIYRAFMRGLGSPNYCNHDAACARNVQHAALSIFGFGRSRGIRLKNAKHWPADPQHLRGHNVKEVNDLLDAKAKRCKITASTCGPRSPPARPTTSSSSGRARTTPQPCGHQRTFDQGPLRQGLPRPSGIRTWTPTWTSWAPYPRLAEGKPGSRPPPSKSGQGMSQPRVGHLASGVV
jgi:hypothetical protein